MTREIFNYFLNINRKTSAIQPYIYIYMYYIYYFLYIYLSTYLSTYLPTYLPTFLPIYLSIYIYIYIYIYIHTYLLMYYLYLFHTASEDFFYKSLHSIIYAPRRFAVAYKLCSPGRSIPDRSDIS